MQTHVTIIGAGQAGLAMSKALSDRAIEHVLLERCDTASAWRKQRWDSLRLLTPNWLTRLPGHAYQGDDPDGYMTATQVASFLNHYRRVIDAPVQSNTTVLRVDKTTAGFCTRTNQGDWHSDAVVVATGACGTPKVPALAAEIPDSVTQLSPTAYKNPSQLSDGRVLVVGASASGAQIADELARSGREVTLAVGDHVRLPRLYRGMDIHWWMDTLGILDESIVDIEDPTRARRLPSLQLIGTPEQRSLGCNELQANGVELIGRLAGVTGSRLQFSGGFANQVKSADLKMTRLLDRIDEFSLATGLDSEVGPIRRPDPTLTPDPRLSISMADIDTIVWATGFRPSYPWLDESLIDRKGAIAHDRGVMAEPGMYVLGLPFLRRRKSSFLDGVGPDALELSAHIHDYLSVAAVGKTPATAS